MLAGDVSVEADGVATRLLPRQLPDVTDFVRGIVYARATDAALLPSSKRYVVHVGGAVGLDAFDVSAQAPSDPSGVRIAGETETGIVHVSERPVEMRWTPDAMNDPVYAEIIPSGVRCSLGATGTSSIASAEFVDSGTLTIHRIHRETFHSPGIDSGEIRFDFARAVAYVHD
jgi:hypothetical protein